MTSSLQPQTSPRWAVVLCSQSNHERKESAMRFGSCVTVPRPGPGPDTGTAAVTNEQSAVPTLLARVWKVWSGCLCGQASRERQSGVNSFVAGARAGGALGATQEPLEQRNADHSTVGTQELGDRASSGGAASECAVCTFREGKEHPGSDPGGQGPRETNAVCTPRPS